MTKKDLAQLAFKIMAIFAFIDAIKAIYYLATLPNLHGAKTGITSTVIAPCRP
ncbi:MAG: hypothetical protein ACOY40_09905 [Bacillota bacterium]